MNIVISYRRSDCEVIAGRIRDRLVAQLGERLVIPGLLAGLAARVVVSIVVVVV